MYTWGYIKEATLAKMDMSVSQAVDMGLMNKMPFYANEAVTQITAAIKAKRAFAEFEVMERDETLELIKRFYNLDDISFLFNQPCDKSLLTTNEQKALDNYNRLKYVGDIVKFPEDFFAWSDDVSLMYDFNERTWVDTNDDFFETYGGNAVMFKRCGKFRIAYKAKWFKILPSTDDSFVLDAPDDILECLPSYIASQLYKIDDEVKSGILRNEFEMMVARIDENDYQTNRTMMDRRGW